MATFLGPEEVSISISDSEDDHYILERSMLIARGNQCVLAGTLMLATEKGRSIIPMTFQEFI